MLPLRAPLAVVTALMLAACHGSTAAPAADGAQPDAATGPSDAAGEEDGADGYAVRDAALDGDAATTDASGPLDATSDSSADAGSLAPLDPLVVGHAWTYDVTELGIYPGCPSGSHTGSVVSSGQRDGRLAYEVQSLCQGLGPYYYSENGDVVSWDDLGVWDLMLDAPVVEGHTWSNGTTTWVWHDLGTVVVPAGSFSQCYKAQDTTGPSYTIFCRGIGPIHWHYDDGLGDGYDAVLTSKNF
jgi:hypothetical protein